MRHGKNSVVNFPHKLFKMMTMRLINLVFSFFLQLQPCFDPKVLQAEANKKEDKKMLLNNSDDLLY